MSPLNRDSVLHSPSVYVAKGGTSEIKGRFSVIVPVFNSRDYLRACLDSILTAVDRYHNAELILIDNGSDDGSYEILLNEYSGRARVEQIRGITVAALRNRGAALAEGEFLSFLDSDCVMDPGYFESALGVLRTSADATGSKHVLRESPNWIEKTWYEIHARTSDGPINYINSGNLVIKRSVFSAVGGFNESLIGTEDVELCLRLSRSGFKIYEAHAVRAVHYGADNSLPVFFRKTAWRSLGMFGLLKSTWMTLPFFTTVAHLFLCLGAVASLFAAPLSLLARLGIFVVLLNLAPAGTVIYRGWHNQRLYAPLQAILLYQVYFLARLYGMCKLIFALDTSSPRARAK